MKTYIYFHVCCINNWKEVFTLLMSKIHDSGLYGTVDEIRCGILGDYSESKELFDDPKIKILYNSSDISLYETPTINQLHEDSKTEDFKVLYIHTKGVRHYNNPKREPFVKDWVNYLSYFNIYKYSLCLQLLDIYDCVGVNLQFGQNEALHYSGNFWWSRASYIRRLEKCIYHHYVSPEIWISKSWIGTYVSMWTSKCRHYEELYDKSNYEGKPLDLQLFSK